MAFWNLTHYLNLILKFLRLWSRVGLQLGLENFPFFFLKGMYKSLLIYVIYDLEHSLFREQSEVLLFYHNADLQV